MMLMSQVFHHVITHLVILKIMLLYVNCVVEVIIVLVHAICSKHATNITTQTLNVTTQILIATITALRENSYNHITTKMHISFATDAITKVTAKQTARHTLI